MTTKIKHRAEIARDYLELVRRFSLVPIRNVAHFDDAIEMIDELSIIDEAKLTRGQSDYLLVLSDLVEKFEDEHIQLEAAFGDGVDALRYLLEQHQMTGSDLGRLLGNRQIGAAILRRTRQLSKANVLKLAAHFNVTADLLLRQKQNTKRRAS
jgi:HTH-type transcriptional regulator / antitoxin HigA